MIKFSLNKLNWRNRFYYLKSIVLDEKNLNQKGSKFQIIRFLPKTKIGPHYHKCVCEIFYLLKGKGYFIFNGQKFIGKKNDIFLCQPKDIHEIINDSSRELVVLIFKTNENQKDIFWIK